MAKGDDLQERLEKPAADIILLCKNVPGRVARTT